MKKLFWILPLSLTILLIGFLPRLLSSSFGESVIGWYLSDRNAKIDIQGLHLRWNGVQTIDLVSVDSKKQQSTIHGVSSSASFLTLLSKNLKKTSIQHVEISLKGFPEKRDAGASSLRGDFSIGTLHVAETTNAVSFSASHVSFSATDNHRSLYLNGESSSAQGKGSIAIALDFSAPLFTTSTPFTLQCTIQRVPSEVLSALLIMAAPEYVSLPSALFGDMVTLELRGDKQKDELFFTCKPYTPTLSGELYARLSKGLFSLSRTSSLSGTISPQLAQMLVSENEFELQSPIHYTCTLDRLAMPVREGVFEWKKSGFEGHIQMGGGRLVSSKHPIPLYLQDLDASLRSENIESTLSISGKIEADYGKQTLSTLFGNIVLQYPFTARTIETLSLHGNQLPLHLIESLSGYPIAQYLGAYGSGLVEYNGIDLKGELSTTLFTTSPFTFTARGIYTLRSPVKITYMTPKRFLENKLSPLDITGTLTSLKYNPNNLEEISGDGSFSIAPFQGSVDGHGFKVRALQCDVAAASLSDIHLKGTSQFQYTTTSLLQSLIPTSMPITFSSDLNGRTSDLTNIHVQIDAPHVSGTIGAAYTGGQFQCTEPATFQIDPAIQLINGNITRLSKDAPIIRSTTPWNIAIDSLTLKETITAKGTLLADEVTFETQNLLFPTTVKKVRTAFTLGENNRYTLSGTVGNGTARATLITGKITSFSFTGDTIPVATLDTLLGVDESYVPVLGDTATLSASLEGVEQCDEAKIQLQAPLLTAAFELERSGDVYTLTKGSSIDWTMTPDGYAALADPLTRMKLILPSHLSITFDAYTFPCSKHRFFPTINEYLSPEAIKASFSTSSLHFVDIRSEEKVSLLQLSSTLDRPRQNAPLSFSVKSSVEGSGKEKKRGVITCKGALDRFTQPDGKFSLRNAHLSIEGEATTIPSSLIDALLAVGGSSTLPPSALFGPSVSMSLFTQLDQGNGPLRVDIHSPYFRAGIHASVSKGIGYLQEPMTATMVMTPRLSSALLGSISVEALSIEKPITLIISPNGFALPLLPFSIPESRIGYGQLDLGQIIVRDTGNPTVVGDIFEVKKRAKTIHLWFAPLDFSIANGVMAIGRTEILYDKTFDIAVWGNVDLMKEYVNMTLGLTAQSLHQALGFQLPKDYVMQVPFRGPINNVKIDKGAALAKIGFLIAREQGKQSNNVYGNIIGILGDLADDQSSVPPAKHPYPWEK